MCTYPFAKKALTLYLACGEGRARHFGCNLMQRKVLASSHQHLMAEAPTIRTARSFISGEYLLRLVMTPSSQELESPGNPGRFTISKGPSFGTGRGSL